MSTAVETAPAPVTFTQGAVKELFKLKDQQEALKAEAAPE
jgi:iron-sulfur cluster assembly protein